MPVKVEHKVDKIRAASITSQRNQSVDQSMDTKSHGKSQQQTASEANAEAGANTNAEASAEVSAEVNPEVTKLSNRVKIFLKQSIQPKLNREYC